MQAETYDLPPDSGQKLFTDAKCIIATLRAMNFNLHGRTNFERLREKSIHSIV